MHISHSAWGCALAGLLLPIGEWQFSLTVASGSLGTKLQPNLDGEQRLSERPERFPVAQLLEPWLPGQAATAAVLPADFAIEEARQAQDSLDWNNSLELLLEPPLLQTKPDPRVTESAETNIASFSSPLRRMVERSHPPTPALPLSLLLSQTVRGVVGRAQRITTDWNMLLPTVVIVPAGGAELLARQSLAAVRQPFSPCLIQSEHETQKTRLGANPDTNSLPPDSRGRYSIWVKGCRVAELPDLATAEQMAQGIYQMLQTPQLDARQIKPVLDRRDPAAALGNRVIFRVSPELAQQLEGNAELLAIAWLNNLRSALGQPPLDLATAQAQLHGLEETSAVLDGLASWYGPYFHGRVTATGEVYNQYDLTAAHRDLPFGTFLKVINRHNGKSVIVRVNDRGPYVDEDLRILDLSYRAATCLDSHETGLADIEAVILRPTPGMSDLAALPALEATQVMQ